MHKAILLAVTLTGAALVSTSDRAHAGLFCCDSCYSYSGASPCYGVPNYWTGPSHCGGCCCRPFCGLFSCCHRHLCNLFSCCHSCCGGSGCCEYYGWGGYTGECMNGCGDTGGDGCDCGAGESYGGYDQGYEGSYDSGDAGYPAEGTESNPKVIYDGPAEGAPPLPNTPEPVPTPSAKATPRATNQLASYSRKRSVEFERGLRLYRDGSLNEAMKAFEEAAASEPKNALYHYHHALVMYDLYGPEAGEEALQMALEAEQQQAVDNWGRQMERIQGPARVWIEKARRNAGLVR